MQWFVLASALAAPVEGPVLVDPPVVHLGPPGAPEPEPPRADVSPLRVEPRAEHGRVTFDHRLAIGGVDASEWSIAPQVRGFALWPSGRTVGILGELEPGATYVVTVPASVVDVRGVPLGEDARVELVGPPPQDDERLDSTVQTWEGRAGLIVLDPADGGRLPIWTDGPRRVGVEVRRVELEDRWSWAAREPLPGERLWSGRLTTRGPSWRPREGQLRLDRWTGADGTGQFLVVLDARASGDADGHVERWVEVTRLGVEVFQDGARAVAWVTDLATGEPVEGATVAWHGAAYVATTGPGGLAELEGPPNVDDDQEAWLVVRRGTDVATLPAHLRWSARSIALHLAGDREAWRPGDTARLAGWVRTAQPGPGGGPRLPGPELGALRWVVHGEAGAVVAEGSVTPTSTGGVAFDVPIPRPWEWDTLGISAWLERQPPEEVDGHRYRPSTTHTLRVLGDEAPRSAHTASVSFAPGPYVAGERIAVVPTVRDPQGGLVREVRGELWAAARPARFVPPGLGGWHFGDDRGERSATLGGARREVDPTPQEVWVDPPPSGGTVALDVGFSTLEPATDLVKASILVHPAAVLVGLRTGDRRIGAGDAVVVESMVVRPDGSPVADVAARVVVEPLGSTRSPRAPIPACEVLHAADGRGACSFALPRGTWLVTGAVRDREGRTARSTLRVWVDGGADPVADGRTVLERLELIPERTELAVGETARVLVRLPFAPAEGVWVTERDGLGQVGRFRAERSVTLLEVPVDEGLAPGFTLDVRAVGAAPREDAFGEPSGGQRVAHASGTVDLVVAPGRLDVGVTEAGGAVEVVVRGPDGRPLPGAEVLVVAREEDDGPWPTDPAETFRRRGEPGVAVHTLRAYVDREPRWSRVECAFGRDDGFEAFWRAEDDEPPWPPQEGPSHDARPALLFAPGLVTGADGAVRVALPAAPAGASVRVVALAARGAAWFGRGERLLGGQP